MTITAPLTRAGYVQTAPACGDCQHSEDEPQGLCHGSP
jgi:hypothetical protein